MAGVAPGCGAGGNAEALVDRTGIQGCVIDARGDETTTNGDASSRHVDVAVIGDGGVDIIYRGHLIRTRRPRALLSGERTAYADAHAPNPRRLRRGHDGGQHTRRPQRLISADLMLVAHDV